MPLDITNPFPEMKVRLNDDGWQHWNNQNKYDVDREQVFNVKYVYEGGVWLEAWWGETCIMEHSHIIEVVWDEQEGHYVTKTS